MAILEQVTQMKSQGIPDQDIYQTLQNQGVSPKEIQDALGQAQIKNAVTGSPEPIDESQMQPSIANAPPTPNQEYQYYDPNQQTQPQEQGSYDYQQQESPQDYSASETSSSENSVEIAEQVFETKISAIRKKIDDLTEFKTLADTKIDSMENRLKRIETSIDSLQTAILEKIGSYGNNLDSVKKEMSMMQDSFRKKLHKSDTSKTKKKKK